VGCVDKFEFQDPGHPEGPRFFQRVEGSPEPRACAEGDPSLRWQSSYAQDDHKLGIVQTDKHFRNRLFPANILSAFLPIALIWSLLGHAPHAKPANPKPADPVTLESVLKKMDETAANFHAVEADFEWDNYERVIDEIDNYQTGTVYYRRNGKDIEMKADVKKGGSSLNQMQPQPKYVLFKSGKIQVYDAGKADQLTVYDLGKNAQDFESYLVLGFGGSGQDLVKSFDVTFGGAETIDGAATGKLQLVPKSDRMRNNIKQILLWIDLERGFSIQQKFITPQGDYRLTKYSSIRMKDKLGDDIFKLKTTNKTQTISPRG
jgi:outer membrane lipoprotein-sorting protein